MSPADDTQPPAPGPVARCRAVKNERKAGRAFLEIFKRLRIGGGRIGMLDALRYDPGPSFAAPGTRAFHLAIKRLDFDTVGGRRHQILGKGSAFQDRFDALQPVLARDLGKSVRRG